MCIMGLGNQDCMTGLGNQDCMTGLGNMAAQMKLSAVPDLAMSACTWKLVHPLAFKPNGWKEVQKA